MRSYAVLIVFVAATIVFGGADGRVASGFSVMAPTDNEIARECPHKAIPNTIATVPFVMLSQLLSCHKSSAAFKRKMGTAVNTDAYRRLFRSGCLQEPAVRACIAVVAADVDICLAEPERRMFATVLDFLDNCIKAVCGDGGEVIATIFGDEFKAMTGANRMRGLSCLTTTAAETMFDREADFPAYTLRKYRGIKEGKQCIVNVAKTGGTSSSQFERFMDQIIDSMKCLTPETNAIVSCSTLETADPIA